MVSKQTSRKGLGLLLGAAFFYSSYGALAKLMVGNFTPFTQAWTRTIVTLFCFFVLWLVRRFPLKVEKGDRKYFLLAGLSASLVSAPTYYSLAHLHIGTALFIQYAATVIIGYILGVVLFKEKIRTINFIALAMAFLGLLLVYSGDIDFNQTLPVLAAIVAGGGFAAYFAFSKEISSKYSSVYINAFVCLCIITVNLILALSFREPVDTNFFSVPWLANIAYGIAGFLGAGLTVYGFEFIEANKGSIVLLAEIVFGILFGLVFFHESLSVEALLGGALILCAIILPNVSLSF